MQKYGAEFFGTFWLVLGRCRAVLPALSWSASPKRFGDRRCLDREPIGS